MDGSTVSVDYLSASGPAKPAESRADSDDADFHAVLSALNPLQYLPVVGTIYRAVTGDTIPEGLRMVGSFIFSGLTGGPVGMAINAATTLAEKVTGIDPESIARDIAEGLGIVPSASHAPSIQEAGTPSAVQLRAGLASYAQFAEA